MPYEVNLRQLFSPKAVAETLQKLGEMPTPVMDAVFATRQTWPLPVIARSEIEKTIGNQPVVRRGAPSLNVDEGTLSFDFIEPQPIALSTNVSAAELNNLKMLNAQGLNAWRAEEIADMRRMIRLTTEAMCAQSLTGKIQYPMHYEGGYTYYEVDYGTPLSYTPPKTWDTAEMSDVLLDLVNMSTLIRRTRGYGARLRIFAGAQAFATLAGKIIALVSENVRFSAQVDAQGINVAGFRIELLNTSYRDHKAGTEVPAVDEKKIVMVATDAPHRLYYLAIDDLDAGLQATPMFVKPVKSDDPSGYKLIAQSKPLPVPVPQAICWAQVLA